MGIPRPTFSWEVDWCDESSHESRLPAIGKWSVVREGHIVLPLRPQVMNYTIFEDLSESFMDQLGSMHPREGSGKTSRESKERIEPPILQVSEVHKRWTLGDYPPWRSCLAPSQHLQQRVRQYRTQILLRILLTDEHDTSSLYLLLFFQ